MPLKSVEQAIADLARLDKANQAYTSLQRAMNDLAEQVNALSEERRQEVFKEIESAVMDWLTDGLPKLDVPDPKPESVPQGAQSQTAYGTGAPTANRPVAAPPDRAG